MLPQRTIGLITGAVFAAMATPALVQGVTCQPQFVSPAICKPAHAVTPTQPPSGGDCDIDGMGQCSPTPGTRCSDRFATAVAGECVTKLNEANPTSCTVDAGVTTVELPKYLAACSDASGPCQCVYTRDTQTTPSQVQVCDCQEQSL
ncbi:MAG: hypothetical protein JNG89_04325 [Planctomycetaceae bacterium]|nr:hypothetical protein [Planctomycetaceae bacterium]